MRNLTKGSLAHADTVTTLTRTTSGASIHQNKDDSGIKDKSGNTCHGCSTIRTIGAHLSEVPEAVDEQV